MIDDNGNIIIKQIYEEVTWCSPTGGQQKALYCKHTNTMHDIDGSKMPDIWVSAVIGKMDRPGTKEKIDVVADFNRKTGQIRNSKGDIIHEGLLALGPQHENLIIGNGAKIQD